mgnify:CR=1 FL=1
MPACQDVQVGGDWRIVYGWLWYQTVEKVWACMVELRSRNTQRFLASKKFQTILSFSSELVQWTSPFGSSLISYSYIYLLKFSLDNDKYKMGVQYKNWIKQAYYKIN